MAETKGKGCYLASAAVSLVIVIVVKLFWPDAVPFRFFEVWTSAKPFAEGLFHIWPALLWGVVLGVGLWYFSRSTAYTSGKSSNQLLVEGFWRSLRAGVLEEISFRWLVFYGSIVGIAASNWLFFGWLGFGIPEWFYLHLGAPIADFASAHQLHNVFYSTVWPWTVGAAVIASNGEFSERHEHLGCIGMLNSRILGIYFFWLVFNYGLLAAIIAHFAYDMVVFSIDAIAENNWK